MKYADLMDAYDAAKQTLEAMTGNDNFPGLCVHDRVYTLGLNGLGWEVWVFVRATAATYNSGRYMPKIELWCEGRSGTDKDWDINHLLPEQLVTLAEIKRTITAYAEGMRDELPPSTSRRWKPKEAQ